MFLSTKFLSTNRHVGLDLQAELDDARAEIRDLRAENAVLQRDLRAERAQYAEQTAELKRNEILLQKANMFNDMLTKERDHFKKESDVWQQKYDHVMASKQQKLQVARANPYAIAWRQWVELLMDVQNEGESRNA